MIETLSAKNRYDDDETNFDSPEYAFQIPGEGVRAYLANRAMAGFISLEKEETEG